MNFKFNQALMFTATSLSLLIAGCSQSNVTNTASSPSTETKSKTSKNSIEIWPTLDIAVKPDEKIEQRIADLLGKMTLAQKVAQTIQPEIRDITLEDMRTYGFGSYLNGGGAFPNGDKHALPSDWVALAEKMYQASIDDSIDGSTIPTMWGTDAVHGHNNVIGATLFPHNIGLGATHNPALIEDIAKATAEEVLATGIDWIFAPTVATVRDDRWGRTYEGYSEDPEIVRLYSAAIVKGLQGRANSNFLGERQVISTVKHFIGDGGTIGGDDQGNNIADEQTLFDIHAQGYVGGLTAGAQTVMASFNSWKGDKVHGNQYLLTSVLKERMGFDGFVVGDWNGHGQIPGCSNESCSQAMNAGLDVFMVPTGAWKPLLENTIAQVKSGEISEARLDDAVTRILRVKLRAGLFDKPAPAKRALSGDKDIIGSPEHRAVARQAVRESLVLLKNHQQLLPLSPNANVLVAGGGADNIGQQSGGWSITWQGTGNTNQDFPGGTSIYQGIKQAVSHAKGHVELATDGKFTQRPDVAIVVFGEQPYAEGNGDLDNLEYQRGNKTDLALLQSLKDQGIPVVSIFLTGRPLWVNPELNASDAFVVAWLPGTEGGGVADVLFSTENAELQHDFKGKLSFSWPKSPTQTNINRFDKNDTALLPYGFGLKYGQKSTLGNALSEETNSDSAQAIYSLAIYDRSVQAPWKMALVTTQKSKTVASSMLENAELKFRTIDRRVQEDAFKIDWLSENAGQMRIYHDFLQDLRSYTEANSVIQFDYFLNSPINAPLWLQVNCAETCTSDIDLRAHMQKQQTWQTLSVDLACFTQNATDFSKVGIPFALRSQGLLSLSLSDIRIVPHAANEADIGCPTE
ncbi:MAG: beta-glucosidase [Alteromonadaceae bacterium]|uniref:glycoside hydrolase family 3 protein n=1 Tax=Paraglaciecola chathamensis TaxID=368405 RepID=UPI000C4B528C|nr:exo 1,3/1,4-beta-D-glucan glucohydrolase [Paraglaciecola agarilytica]MBN26054.1 beta-glucosidase [Alteromonadaceae bacterium]|tara:strand:- start:32537 stop:35107 length:2571 start_codon:yes stop_codon:yes gene_type:complete